jgi:transposase InsO family protein
VTQEDVVYRFRLRIFALAQEMSNVRSACRAMGVHPSTYYRWRKQLLRYGPETLRPRERRQPQMPNATAPFIEQRVLAFALGHPGFGPQRIAAELRRPLWGGFRLSSSGVHRVLRRHGLNTRSRRLALVAGYAAPPEPRARTAPPERHLLAVHPGDLVQMDCFCIGRLRDTAGTVWQYTAIDVASAYAWAELHTSPRNPAVPWTSQRARRVARDLAQRGWRVQAVMTDNGSEFRGREFDQTLRQLPARHIFIRSGRPQTNGCVERLQGTVLEECWKPAFARYLIPSLTGLERDLKRYLHYYNHDRVHTGRWTKGRTPDQVLGTAKLWSS